MRVGLRRNVVKVLASIRDHPERLSFIYFRRLSLRRGASPPVLMDGTFNAVYLGPLWTRTIAEDFVSIRRPIPAPEVLDWDIEFIERLLARMEVRTDDQVILTPADFDHEIRGW